ncbi:MAG: DUF488 domain-containing protein [Methanosarcinaceae archaeon]|jgi:uncharacterized protein (DUF488 family)|nr:DUF488 domain-containing protein [Methanosarcinaceae archaeon]NKQ38637.1 DUF488 domain-containing protein [Methanosarcinales archaeon]
MSVIQQKNKSSSTIVYTIGHSNIEIEEFLGLIHEINTLVDLRSVPYSKFVPQFNINELSKILKSRGIKYVFKRNETIGNIIGGRPKDPTCYDDETICYELVMKKDWYKRGVCELIELAEKTSVVVMCSEEDPYKCHRHNLIAQSLLEKGVEVIHIRKNGIREIAKKIKKKPIQQTLF